MLIDKDLLKCLESSLLTDETKDIIKDFMENYEGGNKDEHRK